jgi:TonB family protein
MAKKPQEEKKGWVGPAVVLLVFAGLIGLLAKVILGGGGAPPKQIQVITLIKPPPPEVKEKPPEPEVPKEAPKQTMEAPSEAPTPQNNDQAADDSPPAGDNLSVDGDGGAGDNAFGLGAKKGGRAITLGGTGGGKGNGMSRLALLSKYGGYAGRIQSDIEKKVRQVLEQNGGRPPGKQQTLVKVTLAPNGTVVRFSIVASSGVEKLDRALHTALSGLQLSEPPPEGMPPSMTLRITTQGKS